MNLERVRLGRQGAADVSSAELVSDSSAGKMPAAPCGSWRAPTALMPCIGTMNLTVGRNLFGVPPSGGPDRLKPGHQTVGSWRALTPFLARMGTMNQPPQQ